ncbi:MAG: hypothetical protein JXA08_02940 [Methanomicrobiaceae archaeon]|nr:hypothetical protein [Methanomicrobiaceae archaeon]
MVPHNAERRFAAPVLRRSGDIGISVIEAPAFPQTRGASAGDPALYAEGKFRS